MTTGELIRALKSGKKIKELVEECRDKRGKLDTDKVYLKFIDAFILSIYTAKIHLRIRDSGRGRSGHSRKGEGGGADKEA